MRSGWLSRRASLVAGLAGLAVLGVGGCRARRQAERPRLVEKLPYQALYAKDGALERLAYDGNGDRRADVITFFGPGGHPLRAELDTDGDGRVDRWEEYGADGKLARAGRSRSGRLRPDLWEIPDGAGGVARREYDDDGDGRVDRAEDWRRDALFAEEFDTDHDGRLDRRVIYGADGQAAAVLTDRDGDGRWETEVPVRR